MFNEEERQVDWKHMVGIKERKTNKSYLENGSMISPRRQQQLSVDVPPYQMSSPFYYLWPLLLRQNQ